MSKKTKVYQKKYELIAECNTQQDAKRLIKEIKLKEDINTNKDFRLK